MKRRSYRLAKSIWMWLCAGGFNPLESRDFFRGLGITFREWRQLKRQNQIAGHPFRISFSMPCFGDRFKQSGSATGHYFFQDLIVARKIFERQPERHIDVGSRVDGFVAHVASFRTIEVLDIRPLPPGIPSIVFRQADLMDLQEDLTACCDSLSCLHALEHFGLGRYGDPIDLYGHLKGFTSLTAILKPKGTLYLSLPIGPQRVDFNACRVFDIQTILDLAHPAFELNAFAYVDDDGHLHEDVTLSDERIANNCGCDYGCGIFEFLKKY